MIGYKINEILRLACAAHRWLTLKLIYLSLPFTETTAFCYCYCCRRCRCECCFGLCAVVCGWWRFGERDSGFERVGKAISIGLRFTGDKTFFWKLFVVTWSFSCVLNGLKQQLFNLFAQPELKGVFCSPNQNIRSIHIISGVSEESFVHI